MRYEIKELGVGGMLDHIIKLCRDHIGFLTIIVCVVLLPIQLPVALWNAWFLPQMDPASIMEMGIEELLVFEMKVLGATLVSAVLLILLNAITQGAVAYGIAHRFLGNEVSAGACIRTALRKWLRLFGAAFVYGLAVGFGMMLCIIPGVFVMLVWYVLFPVLIFEDAPMGRAFGRSNALMNGHKAKAFVLALVLGIMSIGVALVILQVPNPYLSAALNSVAQSFFVGLNSVAATVVYFSARCRTEQFDLALLATMVESKQETEQPAL